MNQFLTMIDELPAAALDAPIILAVRWKTCKGNMILGKQICPRDIEVKYESGKVIIVGIEIEVEIETQDEEGEFKE